MTDEQDSGNNEHEAPTEIPEVESVEPVPSPQSKPATEADLQEVEKQMNAFERSTLKWTRGSFFIVLATAIFIGLQWLEIRSGGADTHDLAVAAKAQANKMKDMSEAADKIRQAAEDMVIQDRRIADNAQRSLNASIAAARNDQRAWLGPTEITPFEFKVGEVMPAMKVTVRNNGKTPAFKFTSQIALRVFKKGEKFEPRYAIVSTPASIDVVQPNGGLQLNTGVGVNKLTEQNIADLRLGDVLVYLFGKGRYEDVFHRTHHFTFCVRVGTDLKSVDSCENYNQAD
jgi:hypothetical protein